MGQFLFQCHIILIIIALCYPPFETETVMPPALSFFLKITLVIQNPLWLQGSFRIFSFTLRLLRCWCGFLWLLTVRLGARDESGWGLFTGGCGVACLGQKVPCMSYSYDGDNTLHAPAKII